MLPKDPYMLLSFVNMKLRDECRSLEDFCDRYEISKAHLTDLLCKIDYEYNSSTNQFV